MGYFEWECRPLYPCEGIPEDSCTVNYCPFPVCEWPEINEALGSISTIRAYPDGEILESDCPGVLSRKSSCKFPAIKVTTESTNEWYDGSANHVIELPLELFDRILFPLIYDDRGQIKNYRPSSSSGKFKIVSNGEIISPIPDVYPSLSEFAGAISDSTPQFFLAANATKLLCGTGPSTIQLLKITP